MAMTQLDLTERSRTLLSEQLRETRTDPVTAIIKLFTFYEPIIVSVEQNFTRYDQLSLNWKVTDFPLDNVEEVLEGAFLWANMPPSDEHWSEFNFDCLMLRLLKSLNHYFSNMQAGKLRTIINNRVVDGFEGKQFWLYRRNDYIDRELVLEFGENQFATSNAFLTGSMQLYLPDFRCIEVKKTKEFFELDLRPDTWCPANIRSRITQVAAQRKLTIVMKGFGPAVEDFVDDFTKEHCSLKTPVNLQRINEAISKAIDFSRQECATILVLPELSLCDDNLNFLIRLLQNHPPESPYPILVVAGLAHRSSGDGNLDLNEAVLIDYAGRELARHRKLRANPTKTESGAFIAEHLKLGTRLIVLPTDVGQISILICQDLIDQHVFPLLQTGVTNLLLVPSMSNGTNRHQSSADSIWFENRINTFVANRPIREPRNPATRKDHSFYRTGCPTKPVDKAVPEDFLVFRLSDCLKQHKVLENQ